MPLYEYECKKCHHRFEKIQTFSARHVKKCPECGGPIEQVITAPSVQFKGSGWYVTDYPKKSATGASGSNGDSPKDSGKDSAKDSGKDSAKSESKGEEKSKGSEEKSKSDDKPKSEKKKAEKK